ncbi:unnamed protein product [Closterium sp. NIES-64]|nr:unnamed protein product [Closterium sp. NIES-64]
MPLREASRKVAELGRAVKGLWKGRKDDVRGAGTGTAADGAGAGKQNSSLASLAQRADTEERQLAAALASGKRATLIQFSRPLRPPLPWRDAEERHPAAALASGERATLIQFHARHCRSAGRSWPDAEERHPAAALASSKRATLIQFYARHCHLCCIAATCILSPCPFPPCQFPDTEERQLAAVLASKGSHAYSFPDAEERQLAAALVSGKRATLIQFYARRCHLCWMANCILSLSVSPGSPVPDSEERQLAAALASGKRATLIQFYARRCRLCRSLSQLTAELARRNADWLNVVPADVENSRWLPEVGHYSIKYVPFYVLLDARGRAFSTGGALEHQVRAVLRAAGRARESLLIKYVPCYVLLDGRGRALAKTGEPYSRKHVVKGLAYLVESIRPYRRRPAVGEGGDGKEKQQEEQGQEQQQEQQQKQ